MNNNENNAEKTAFISLGILAGFAGILGFFVQIIGYFIYNQPLFGSISASATYFGTMYILPFILGAMFLFFISYRGYDKIDMICSKIMAVGAFGVAMFQCSSGYIDSPIDGLFGLSKNTSNIIHSLSALLLFITMIYWTGWRFTLGILIPSPQKKWRNRLYRTCALIALISTVIYGILTFIPGILKGFSLNIWMIEQLILLPLSVSIACKSGAFLKDK